MYANDGVHQVLLGLSSASSQLLGCGAVWVNLITTSPNDSASHDYITSGVLYVNRDLLYTSESY